MAKRTRKPSNGVSRTNRKTRVLLETSGVIFHLLGPPIATNAVESAISGRAIESSTFIRMEFLRGVIRILIDLFFLIKESDSVADALAYASQSFSVRRPKIILMSARLFLQDHDDPASKEKSLRRLGDAIVRLVHDFDDKFHRKGATSLSCQLGALRLPAESFTEDVLLDFVRRYEQVWDKPVCGLCEFAKQQQVRLKRDSLTLWSNRNKKRFASNKGYVTQVERLEVLEASPPVAAKCTICEKVGDSIISLECPSDLEIITVDSSFVAFGDALGRFVNQLPSLIALKNQYDANKASGNQNKKDRAK